jgi:hypothetical protein
MLRTARDLLRAVTSTARAILPHRHPHGTGGATQMGVEL